MQNEALADGRSKMQKWISEYEREELEYGYRYRRKERRK
jgi:hypothetical protein